MKNLKAWILVLVLAGATAGTLALADGGLFPTPSAGSQKGLQTPTSLFPRPNGSLPQGVPVNQGVPDCGSHSACFQFFANWRLSQTKRALAGLAEQLTLQLRLPAKCIHRTEAFGFENPAPNVWRVNCLAEKNGTLTHLIDYEMGISMVPADCASDQAIRAFADSPFATSRGSANTFMRSLAETGCHFVASPNGAPFVSPITTEWLQKVLEQRQDVTAIVSEDRRVKVGSPGSGVGPSLAPSPRAATNPLGDAPGSVEDAQ